MPEIRHTVAPEEAGRQVKSLALGVMGLSRGLFSSLKFSGGLSLDGMPVRADRRVEAGQVLAARWEEKASAVPAPAAADYGLVWEDAYYAVLDKPAPLPTLSSARQGGPSLESAVCARLGCQFRPVNRLDKGTSGLLAAAKDRNAQQRLQRLLHTEDFLREYLAVCRGAPPCGEGAVDLPIGRGEGVRRAVDPAGRRAVTHYRVEQTAGELTLLRLRRETGRTHQIRVHLAALGCPVLGDYLYGEADPRLPGRFALHACRLRFLHPFTGEEVALESPLPEALRALL